MWLGNILSHLQQTDFFLLQDNTASLGKEKGSLQAKENESSSPKQVTAGPVSNSETRTASALTDITPQSTTLEDNTSNHVTTIGGSPNE